MAVKEMELSTRKLENKMMRVPQEFNKMSPKELSQEIFNQFSDWVDKNDSKQINDFGAKIENNSFGVLVKGSIQSVIAGMAVIDYTKKIREFRNKGITSMGELVKDKKELEQLRKNMINNFMKIAEDAEKAAQMLKNDKTPFASTALFITLSLEEISSTQVAKEHKGDVQDKMARGYSNLILGKQASNNDLEDMLNISMLKRGKEAKVVELGKKIKEMKNAGAEERAEFKWFSEFSESLESLLLPKLMKKSGFRARLHVGQRVLDLQDRLISISEELLFRATHDTLTGVANRGVILDMVSRERMRQSRDGKSFGIVMADIDHFKYVNDTYGHPIGDVVLQETSKRMAASVRPYDFVGRYGGEEFLIVVPASDVAGLMGLAERIRKAVESKPVHTEVGEIAITASFGAAVSTESNPHEAQDLLRLADDALYRAKQHGRNRCELASEEEFATLNASTLGLGQPDSALTSSSAEKSASR